MQTLTNLPKTVPARWLNFAKVGDSILCAGHGDYSRAPLVRKKIGHTTQALWIVGMTKEPPVAATLITLV